jgi:cytidine deaminase
MQYTDQQLVTQAREVAGRAYAPYSRFYVGAVLVGKDGRIFAGCNVENISFGLTICAERNAVFAAVAAGCREFARIVIVADTAVPASPCGACRQVLAEFNPDLEVVLATFRGLSETFRLSELLPRPTAGILDRP